MKTRILLAAVLLFAAGSLTRADDKPLERSEIDKRVVGSVYEAAKAGTDIFNKGNHEGCYRLYEGTLLAVVPMLDHKAKLQAIVKKRLENAKTMKASDAAFELRTALDEIQNEIAPSKDAPAGKKTLWDRLGGEKSVKLVVTKFVGYAAADPKVDFTRGGKYPIDAKGREKLEQSLVEMISANTGGPLKYTGKSMKESHKGMAITEAEFNALAGILVKTLEEFKVGEAEIKELVTIVASTKADIVEGPKKPVDPPVKPVDPPKEAKKALWDRLGGEKAVKLVVHEFVEAAAADKKVNFTRGKPLDPKAVPALEQSIVEMISANTGGPLKYTGKNMKEAHKGMAITDAEFDALAGHLLAVLKKNKVPQEEIDELVKLVLSTKADIVEKK